MPAATEEEDVRAVENEDDDKDADDALSVHGVGDAVVSSTKDEFGDCDGDATMGVDDDWCETSVPLR